LGRDESIVKSPKRCFVFERRHLDQVTVAMSTAIGPFDPGEDDLQQNGNGSLPE